jgi:hypothetical protein
MMISKRTILCLALLASTAACGGGGGGGASPNTSGGGTTNPGTGGGGTTTTTTPPPPPVGSTNFSNPSVVMTTNDGTATMASDTTSQVVTMKDGATQDPNPVHKDFIVVNIDGNGISFGPLGTGDPNCKGACSTTGHAFDITADLSGGAGATPATANFPNDPTFFIAKDNLGNTVTFENSPNLLYSIYGIWEGKDDKTGAPIAGAFATASEGSTGGTPFTTAQGLGATLGTAEYDGNAIGLAVTGGTVIHLDGTTKSPVDFKNMTVSTTWTLNNAANGHPFQQLNAAMAPLVAGPDGTTRFGNSVTSADGQYTGTQQGGLFGPNAQELGAVVTAKSSTTTITAATGAVQAH